MWAELLSQEEILTLPWTGGRELHGDLRAWTIAGDLPREHGWHRFQVDGSKRATWVDVGEADPCFDEGRPTVRGYLVGDHIIADNVSLCGDILAVFRGSEQVWLVEPGLERFARVLVARHRDGRLYYVRQEFPQGPEFEVVEAWQDDREDLDDISGVPPALDGAYRWLRWQKYQAEEHRRELARQAAAAAAEAAAEAERMERRTEYRARLDAAAVNRMCGAQWDFETVARDALAVSGAELMDHRPSVNKDEMIVQFRFRDRRFECACHQRTLRITDSGICLIDHATEERGDTRFTLESLPGVINEAIDDDKLVVFRHVAAPRPADNQRGNQGNRRGGRRARRRDRNRNRRR